MSEKIRVLHFANVVNKNDFVDSLVSNFDKERFDITVVTFTSEAVIQAPNYASSGIRHYVLNIHSRMQYVSAIRQLFTIIKKNRIDILHTHMFDEAFLGAVVKLMYPRIRFILGRHYSDEIYLTAKGWRRARSLWVESFANRFADKIITVSSFINNLLIQQKTNPEKLFRTTYGFDFSQPRYSAPPENEIKQIRSELQLDGKFVILNVGRHYFLKRQDLLIEAFDIVSQKYEDMRLLLVGDGPWNAHLRSLVLNKGLDSKVAFLGWRKDVPKLINLADVVVQPTLTEAFPQIMIEVMAQAKPLVISKVSGPDDQVNHKETGYLIQPNSLEDIVEALEFMYHHRDCHSVMGEQAREFVRERLDIRKVIKEYEKLYSECLSQKS